MYKIKYMNRIIKFLFKWVFPIGLVELLCKRNDNLLLKDTIGKGSSKQTYWRVYDSKIFNGAGVLIRRS